MKMSLWIWVLLLGMPSAFAQVIKPGASHFKTVGKQDSFRFTPPLYRQVEPSNPFRYDIFYYVPESLRGQTQVPALIFNHGGGDSTLTREGSIETVWAYFGDLKQMADDLGFVAVLPSANGLNWGGHTVPLMKALVSLMRHELNVDSNRIGLSGHSMGGMGITRSFPQLADEFAFFMPLAAGMDLSYAPESVTDWQINKVFNVPYIHIQGLYDSFHVFVTRCREQERRTRMLEWRYLARSKLKMIYTNTDHDYDLKLFEGHLAHAFKTPRNLYQKQLYGTLSTGPVFAAEANQIHFAVKPVKRYFWIEAIQPDQPLSERVDFRAYASRERIDIQLEKPPARIHELKLYLHSKMIDLHSPLTVYVNGAKVATRNPENRTLELRSMSASDPGFQFEDVMRIELPRKKI